MSTLFKRQMSQAAGAVCAAAALIAASPAIANTTVNTATATADVTKPLEEAEGDTLTKSDDKFRDLFASWVALDKQGSDVPIEDANTNFVRSTVAVPSGMPLKRGRISSGYGMRRHPVLRQRRKHKGIDLAAPTGTPIYATADGVVSRANWFSSYGLYISIEHGGELQTRYAHLSRLAVASGERVKKGELIGYVGSTGRSTGPHLHYEVRVSGVAVNPIPYMKETKAQVAYESGEADLTGQGGE